MARIEDIEEALDGKANKSVTDKVHEDFNNQSRQFKKMIQDVNDLKTFEFNTKNDLRTKAPLDFVKESLKSMKEGLVQTKGDVKKIESDLVNRIFSNEKQGTDI